jgi:hypothetical protein
VRNVLWGAGALAILLLSFTLPLGDFRLSLNRVGTVSRPLTKASFAGDSKDIYCPSLEFELKSRDLARSNFWLEFAMFCLMAGLGAYVYAQPTSDHVLLVIALALMGISFTWSAHAYGLQQRQFGAGQVLYSSHCLGNP